MFNFLKAHTYVSITITVSKHLAIQQLIYSYLWESVVAYTVSQPLLTGENTKISLYRGKHNKKILYISGVALQFSKSHNLMSMEIAMDVVSHLSTNSEDVFSVQVVPPGWIHLELTDLFMAAWLQSLTGYECLGSPQTTNDDGAFFPLQYAHARCSSLLSLAHREGLIQGQHIPWLNHSQQLRLSHPAEIRLIGELVTTMDNLQCPHFSGAVNFHKIALNLSLAFDAFWRSCRIWGSVKSHEPELTQSRLGLLMATQSVFRFLLVSKLGLAAPLDL